MPCYGPLTGFYSKDISQTGKRKIVFDPRLSNSAVPIKLPCGQCIGCRLERSRQWAMRLLHERKFHEHSAFLTLTYRNEDLPPGGTLVKRDFQLFMKRYRKSLDHKIKFFMCGEYGDRNARPHYHVIVYGHDFADKKYFSSNRRGDKYYTSAELGSLWRLGHNVIGAVTFDSCAYVARYLLKKVTGKLADDHYSVIDGNGEVFQRLPEYTDQSNGLGKLYYERFFREVYTHDSVVINGKEVRPPKYYDGMYELTNPGELCILKRKRRQKALLFKADNTSRRRWVKETIQLKRLKLLERKV
jgi:hypothetical protein